MHLRRAEEFVIDCAAYLEGELLEKGGLGLDVTLVEVVTHFEGLNNGLSLKRLDERIGVL